MLLEFARGQREERMNQFMEELLQCKPVCVSFYGTIGFRGLRGFTIL
jgi:hypothetical protein